MAYSSQGLYAKHLLSGRGYVGVVVPEGGSFDVFSNAACPLRIRFIDKLACQATLPPFRSAEGILPSFLEPSVQVVSFQLPQWQGGGARMHMVMIQVQKGTR